MSQLSLIIRNEYKTDISAKSFWISTFAVPVLMLAFGGVAGYLMSESDSVMKVQNSIIDSDPDSMTPLKAIGLMMGMFLTIFIMMYGSMIFQKVKTEKTNRIVEILATCVQGRTMMLAKIIAVGLVGFTQLFLWGIIIIGLLAGIVTIFSLSIPWQEILTYDYIMAIIWSILYFVGGYIFFGSLFAAVGAMTDKNNENQEYVAVLTFILLISFYIGEYAVDHGNGLIVRILSYVPFTSPTIGAVNAITQTAPIWESIISVIILLICAWGAMAIAGKIYTSSILLKGKKFSPKDIVTFFKAK
ncbi:MAG: ABC transporter permease [Muribaculaceae bacterium]|nr:ABC transporter permease [Muribaculaceae bacterium]